MIANGIYVKNDPNYLAGELSGGMRGLKRIESIDDLPPDSSASIRKIVLYLQDQGNGWSHIQMTGDPDGIALVAGFLTGHKTLEKVLVWDCSHELMEYSYSFFQGGKLLEQFSVRGPALETVSFVSELREVQLQDMIKGRKFAEEAFERFGIHPGTGKNEESANIRIDFALPPKRSIWKSLLGSLADGE